MFESAPALLAAQRLLAEQASSTAIGWNTAVVTSAATLFGAASGAVGSFALLRRRALFADAMGHATLPGLALAFLALTAIGVGGWSPLALVIGGGLTATLMTLIGLTLLARTRLDADAVIGTLGSSAFGLGILLLSVVQAIPGVNPGSLRHVAFGHAASMLPGDTLAMALLALLALATLAVFGRRLIVLAFDEPFARTRGLPVAALDALLLGLVLITTLSGLRAVGLVLVVAMLVLPAAAARLYTDSMPKLLTLAVMFGASAGAFGCLVSASFERVPTGPAIVLTAAVPLLLGLIAAPQHGLLGRFIRERRRQRMWRAEIRAERSS